VVGVRPDSKFGLNSIACLMAAISESFAPSVHAADTSNITWTLGPSALQPITVFCQA